MNAQTHSELANFIWSICNLLRGPYKRNEYRKVILPLTVLRRFDCVLADTKDDVLAAAKQHAKQSENVRHQLLAAAAQRPFYNTSPFDFARLLDDPNHIAANLNAYIAAYSPNVRDIMERFDFEVQIGRMDEKDLLFQVVQRFAGLDLSPQRVDNMQMGYVFEELIRIGAEQSNEEAGEHFTPREVIGLMVSLLLSPEADLGKPHIVKTIYDPACGTGGMLTVAEKFLRDHNAEARPHLFGQDINDESWAVCRSDMLIKGDDADRIVLGDSFTADGYQRRPDDTPWTFDYMLANPPFGVEWKQQKQTIEKERDTFGYQGRFGAGLPRINDGSLLFLQHMLSKMQPVAPDGTGGSRIAIVFNGSPLFTGDAGSGESNIRKWIIENDWLEAIVALPDQLFYNTGISTYIWILTNRKEKRRRGKVQLIDAREFFVKMRRSLGNKRNELSPEQIADLTRIHGSFTDGETRDLTDEDPITHEPRTRPRVVSRVFDNDDFGYRKITVERPLRLNFAAIPERIALIEDQTTFVNLAKSRKHAGAAHDVEVTKGQARQQAIRDALATLAETTDGETVKDRDAFMARLRAAAEAHSLRLSAPERKAVLAALSERDPTANICENRNGEPEPDARLRDTQSVPLDEDIDAYMEREVLPHVPDARVDHDKTKIGYEIPLNRHFYVYEPPRPLEVIEADLRTLETEIAQLLAEVTA
ncbi:type I restriction-modification system subunit M [Candidatus Poriferisodalis sp.]|uniref:type I restriction-modification system subunit M n=1 Tax=Candidatus Poriferisodalis sp. TaxID=3101277 RepID=UPI003B5C3477